jgi:hypothetical protein
MDKLEIYIEWEGGKLEEIIFFLILWLSTIYYYKSCLTGKGSEGVIPSAAPQR